MTTDTTSHDAHGSHGPAHASWPALARREAPHWLVLGAMFVATAVAWSRVTPPIPTHWNIRGEVDGTGGRVEALLFVPLLATGLYALLLVLPRFDPGRANYASFSGPYALMRITLTAMMGAMHALLLATALGYPVDAGRWIPLGVGVLLVVFGNITGKVRPNYFVGIKTPWTLASARSWEKTHRVGGRLFVAAGIGLAIAALVRQPWLFAVVGIGGGGGLVALIAYSYIVWRDDPDRIPVTGTRPAEQRDGKR